jgi:hypothetical protein
MGKTVSIYVPDDVARRMENFPEVKWTTVVRPCILDYLKKIESAFPDKVVTN